MLLNGLVAPATIGPETLGFAGLHAVAVALFAVVLLAWSRHAHRRRLVASGFITVAAIVVVYLVMVRPRDIPIEWITILSHGFQGKSIMHLYAHGLNVGPGFDFVVSAVAGPAPTLRDLVWLNLLLAAVNAAIFLHLAAYVTGAAWALPWTLVFALNPAMFLAAFSELPTHLLALYFLIGLIAWAVVVDPLPQGRPIRAAAYALGAVLTVLVALTRFEVATIGAVALGLRALHAALRAPWSTAAGQRLTRAGEELLAFLSRHPAAVIVACVAGTFFSQGIPYVMGRGGAAVLYPFNPSFLSLFFYLPLLLLPVGASIAILLGFIRAVEEFLRFGGLALSLFILVRVYFATWSEYFEMGRYMSYILPAIFFLGLFGKAELEQLARRWRPNWGRAAQVGYLMAWITLPLPGAIERYARPEYRADGGFSQLLLDLNTQREARHLVALTEHNPQCVFVSRVVEDRAAQLAGPPHQSDPKTATEYVYVVFGAPIAQPIVVAEKEARLDDVIARYAAGAACVRLYYGGDCNLNFTDHCRDFVAGRRLVDEQRFWSRPYNNPLQSGYGAPEIVLATYEWAPRSGDD